VRLLRVQKNKLLRRSTRVRSRANSRRARPRAIAKQFAVHSGGCVVAVTNRFNARAKNFLRFVRFFSDDFSSALPVELQLSHLTFPSTPVVCLEQAQCRFF
jgi:hypothetical protein